MTDNTISENTVAIERTFDAPVDLIWQLWTQPEHFKQWYGPEGFSVPVAQMDVQVGGKRLVCMEVPTEDGTMTIWTTGEFTEISPTTRLVYTESMADEHGNVVQQAGYPHNTVVTVQLEDLGGRTKMTMTHAGLPGNADGANGGWNQSFDKLVAYLPAVTGRN